MGACSSPQCLCGVLIVSGDQLCQGRSWDGLLLWKALIRENLELVSSGKQSDLLRAQSSL